MKMTWSEVHKQGDYTRIIFKQKKTSGQEYIDITPQAAELLGERRNPTDLVFNDFLTASATTMCPGIYYVRLMKECDLHAYEFHATDWTTGDAGRVSAQNVTYDEEKNIIHVKASGNNNVCLKMKDEQLDYTIDKSQIYFVVRGTNLDAADTKSYLWWLNGSNYGTQVKPTKTQTLTVAGQQETMFAWDMTKSGLYENFSADRPSVCMGWTIFGLTSTTGLTDIHDINFVSSLDDYLAQATAINVPCVATWSQRTGRSYDLQGRSQSDYAPASRISIINGKKIITK